MAYVLHNFAADVEPGVPLPTTPTHGPLPRPSAAPKGDSSQSRNRPWRLSTTPRPSTVMRPLPSTLPPPGTRAAHEESTPAEPLLVPNDPPPRDRPKFVPVPFSSHTQHLDSRAPPVRADPGCSSNSLRRKLLGKTRLVPAPRSARTFLPLRRNPSSSQQSLGDTDAPSCPPSSRGQADDRAHLPTRSTSRGTSSRRGHTPRPADTACVPSRGSSDGRYTPPFPNALEADPALQRGPKHLQRVAAPGSPAAPEGAQGGQPSSGGGTPAGKPAPGGRTKSCARNKGGRGRVGGSAGDDGGDGGRGGGGGGSDVASHASGDLAVDAARCSVCDRQDVSVHARPPGEAPICERCSAFMKGCRRAGLTDAVVMDILSTHRFLLQLPPEECCRAISQIGAQRSEAALPAPGAAAPGLATAATTVAATAVAGKSVSGTAAADDVGQAPVGQGPGGGSPGHHERSQHAAPRGDGAQDSYVDVAAAIMQMRTKAPTGGDTRSGSARDDAPAPGSGAGAASARAAAAQPSVLDPANFNTTGQCVICQTVQKVCLKEYLFCACETCAALWHECTGHGFTFREVQRAFELIGMKPRDAFMKQALSLKQRGQLSSAASGGVDESRGERAAVEGEGGEVPQSAAAGALTNEKSAPTAQPVAQQLRALDEAMQQAAKVLLHQQQGPQALQVAQQPPQQTGRQPAALQSPKQATQQTPHQAAQQAAHQAAQQVAQTASQQASQQTARASQQTPQTPEELAGAVVSQPAQHRAAPTTSQQAAPQQASSAHGSPVRQAVLLHPVIKQSPQQVPSPHHQQNAALAQEALRQMQAQVARHGAAAAAASAVQDAHDGLQRMPQRSSASIAPEAPRSGSVQYIQAQEVESLKQHFMLQQLKQQQLLQQQQAAKQAAQAAEHQAATARAREELQRRLVQHVKGDKPRQLDQQQQLVQAYIKSLAESTAAPQPPPLRPPPLLPQQQQALVAVRSAPRCTHNLSPCP